MNPIFSGFDDTGIRRHPGADANSEQLTVLGTHTHTREALHLPSVKFHVTALCETISPDHNALQQDPQKKADALSILSVTQHLCVDKQSPTDTHKQQPQRPSVTMPGPPPPNPNPPTAPDCIPASKPVVVGAGPSGSLTSLLLLKRQVAATLLEKDTRDSKPDVTRVYSQQMFMRGRRIVCTYPKLEVAVRKRAIDTSLQVQVISHPDGKSVVIRKAGFSPDGIVDWRLLRPPLIEAMREVVEDEKVDLKYESEVVDVEYEDDGWMTVVTKGGERFRTRFLIACDGQWSAVAKSLKKATEEGKAVFSKNGFGATTYRSPSVGLTRKTVLIRKEFMDSIKRSDMREPEHTTIFLGQRKGRSSRRYFHTVAFPITDEVAEKLGGRISSIITYPGHALWDLKTVEEGFALFEENFPQLDVKAAISEESMRLFVEAQPSRYPLVSRRNSIVARVGKQREGGVILLGDASHWTPPDLGQGLNAALEDSAVLANIIDAATSDASICDIVDRYEQDRDDDISALIHLSRHSVPFQYGQSRIGSYGTSIKVRVKAWLSQRIPGMHPASMKLITQDYSYSEIQQMTDSTTRKIVAGIATLVLIPVASIAAYKVLQKP